MSEMTIKRGLTRIKTIKAQIERITKEIQDYATWNNKKNHPLGERNESREKQINQAEKTISSQFQKFNDLQKELLKIKFAIEKANISATISVNEQVMTLSEAIAYKQHLSALVDQMVNAYNYSVAKTTREVERYNEGIENANHSDAERKALLADIAYLAPKKELEKLSEFQHEFLAEIDGLLDEANATTKITIE
jgi:hypothetical protein